MAQTKKYKFITIKEKRINNEFTWQEIINNKSGASLGSISFYHPWRQYVMLPNEGTAWSTDCLKDIIDFMENEI